MLKIMDSQTEVNNNKVLGVDDYELSQEMSRTALVVKIEKRGFEKEQGGKDLEAVNLVFKRRKARWIKLARHLVWRRLI